MNRTTLSLLILLATSATTSARDGLRLVAAGSDDLIPSQLIATPDPGINPEHAPVQFAWVIDHDAQLESIRPFIDESRQFQATVKGTSLQRGYRIDTTAPGAVIRISPQGDPATRSGNGLRIDDLQIEIAGRWQPASQVTEGAADAAQLRQAGAPFSEGTMVFRVRPSVGATALNLRAAKARGQYLIQVLEPQSRWVLRLGATHDSVLAGSAIDVSARLYDGDRIAADARLGGVITAPDGRSFDLRFDADGQARAALPGDAASQPGLWEVHTFAAHKSGNGRVLRDAKTAIAVVAPTARLRGDAEFRNADGIELSLPLEVATAGRYQVSGVLYGTDARGNLRPMAAAQSADWLEAGEGRITLRFGPEVLAAGLKAPYAVRDLRLFDQTRMGLLERRAAGIETLDNTDADVM